MDDKKFYATTFAGIAFCLCLTVYGVLIFIKSEQIDYYTCVYLFTKIVPYSIIVAVLGYFIGQIIDKASNRPQKRRKK